MGNILDVNPGLIVWTLINFFIFIFLFSKLFLKPITNSIKKRGQVIQDSLDEAARNNQEAKEVLRQAQEKISTAQQEMAQIVASGKAQSEELLKKAATEAEAVKHKKLDDAIREIERNKEIAILELRKQVASMVVNATEKILNTELDQAKHKELIDTYIDKMPKN